MGEKKFTEYDMRDDFSLAVYASFSLKSCKNIKVLNSEETYAGQLTRLNGETYLDLAADPIKKGYESKGIVFDDEDKIQSYKDRQELYLTSLSGNLIFVVRKYFRLGVSHTASYNHATNPVSHWRVTDFLITSQFKLKNKIQYMELSIDNIFSWFSVYDFSQDLNHVKSIKFDNLIFGKTTFFIELVGSSNQRTINNIQTKNMNLTLNLTFEDKQNEDQVFQISVALRNLLQILMGKKVGISKIILNKNKSRKSKTGGTFPRDWRENWILEQSYLPEKADESQLFFETQYSDIKTNFDKILINYLGDTRLQQLVNSYLTIVHFKVPVSTSIIALVSGVESYYNNTMVGEKKDKKLQDAGKKLSRFMKLLDNPKEDITSKFGHGEYDIVNILQRLRDARDYFIHGVKAEKFTSEEDLVPDLQIFQFLYRKVLIRIITLEVDQNN